MREKKALPQDTYICFGSIVEYVEDDCDLNEIRFSDINKIKTF